MIRFLITRLLLPLLIFWLLRSLLRGIFVQPGRAPQTTRGPQQPPVPAGGDLMKDPVCGTFVSPGAAITRKVKGETVYFCSAECRDKYSAG
jgi:YHS domain-containing protein